VRRPRVVIIQRRMTHYRLPLFEMMREMLEKRGIELTVVFGDPTEAERAKHDTGYLSWGAHVPTRYLLNGRLCWQNASGAVQGADLVVVTQENKLIFNHLLMLRRRRFRLAFWGHGRNFQASNARSMSERFKGFILRRADWWFAYTESSAEVVRASGFPGERITVLNNAIDTHALDDDLQSLSPDEIAAGKREFGIGPGPVGIMLSSLHADKRVEFLIAAAEKIRLQIADFQLLVVGDGPQHDLVEAAARRSGGWIHCLGAHSGRRKALFLAMSKVMLNPGMVGLGVLDSFVAGVPMITTDCGVHSPEIAYLKSEENGLITNNTVDAFASGVISLLRDDSFYSRLQANCKASAKEVSLEKMVQRFCEGIERNLIEGGMNFQPVVAS